jgi:hypothetical protein
MTITSIDAQRHEQQLRHAYHDFNARHVGAVLNLLHSDVDWANAATGGRVHGHLAVRDHWLTQWQRFDPYLVPVRFAHQGDTITAEVIERLHALDGTMLREDLVWHRYEFREGKVTRLDILDADTRLPHDADSAATDVETFVIVEALEYSAATEGDTLVIVETLVVEVEPR